MEVGVDHLIYVLSLQVGFVDTSELVAGESKGSELSELGSDLKELVPAVQKVLV